MWDACRSIAQGHLTGIGLVGFDYLQGQPLGQDDDGNLVGDVSSRYAPRVDLGIALQLFPGPVRMYLEGRVAGLYYSGVGFKVGPVGAAGLTIRR